MRDLAIIGGGPIGLAAALALQHPARRVAVIEAGNLEQPESGGLNARSIALAASSVQIFRALGVWQSIEAHAAPIRHIHVSARGRWGVTRLEADDYGLDALGYVVESALLNRSLLDAAAASDLIDIEQNAEVTSLAQDGSVCIDYRQQGETRQLESRLALVADGAGSPTRAALGIGASSLDYGQAVVICNAEVARAKPGTAFERFTAEGPLAMLPLGGKRYACVWTQGQARAQTNAALDDRAFIAALQEWFGYRLGRIERVGTRFTIPIVRTSADRLHRGRCFLIGNAANALHPVAGQSFNLSLRDIACLYELLLEVDPTALGADAMAVLGAAYQQQRDAEQQQVIRYGDGLVTLFSNRLPLFDQLRAAGLGLLDLAPALKAQAAFAGMGLSFGGNRLLRGHL